MGAQYLQSRKISINLGNGNFFTVFLDYIEREKKPEILKYYESRLFITGRQVFVSNFQNDYAATVLGIDDAAALIVQTEKGSIQHITSGEIRLH